MVRKGKAIRRSHASVFATAALLALTGLAYLPVLDAGFIWDDDNFLYDNALIHDANGLYRFWFTAQAPDYFPLVSTSLWIEWRLWGLHAAGYHAVNVVLHALTAVLFWRVLRRLAVPGAWLAAAIFAVHPVNVESVAWITERKNTLPMVFYGLTLLTYLHFEVTGQRRWYGLALLAFLLALLSKTSVVMLPFVLLGCAAWQRGRIARADLMRSVPFFALALAFGLVTAWFQHYRSIGDDVVRTDGLASRLAIAGWAVWFYLYKALLPLRLSFVYPRWEADTSALLTFLPGLALLVGFGLLVRYRRTWGRGPLFGLGYFVVTLVPVLGLANIYFMRYSLVADHWQYTSIIGVIALAVGLLAEAVRRRGAAAQGVARGSAAAVVLVLAVLTWRQAQTYQNEQVLYEATLAYNPGAWMARNNLGGLLNQQGRYAEALPHLTEALRLKPDFADAHNNLGDALTGLSRLDEAVEQFGKALALRPNYLEAHFNLARALVLQGKVEEAIAHYRMALQQAPDNVRVLTGLATALTRQGRFDEAIVHHRRLVELNPRDAATRHALANALAAGGQLEEALVPFAESVRLDPGNAQARYDMGSALIMGGRFEEGVTHLRAALALRPDWPDAYNNLGIALSRLGRFDEAAQQYREALRLRPDFALAQRNLADALSRLGETATSEPHTP